MKIDLTRLDLFLAQQCKSVSDLRTEVSPQTLTRIRRGRDVLPKTAGKLAKGLGVPVTDIIKEGD